MHELQASEGSSLVVPSDLKYLVVPMVSLPVACRRAVLFVPKTVQFDFYDKYYEKGAKGALKLYVRRVFITGTHAKKLPSVLYVGRRQEALKARVCHSNECDSDSFAT